MLPALLTPLLLAMLWAGDILLIAVGWLWENGGLPAGGENCGGMSVLTGTEVGLDVGTPAGEFGAERRAFMIPHWLEMLAAAAASMADMPC